MSGYRPSAGGYRAVAEPPSTSGTVEVLVEVQDPPVEMQTFGACPELAEGSGYRPSAGGYRACRGTGSACRDAVEPSNAQGYCACVGGSFLDLMFG